VEQDSGQQPFDLDERTYQFARQVRQFVRRVPRSLSNYEDCKQLIRASGSVGANYIEANEPLGDKDFILHIEIARKEAKESRYWLRLLDLSERRERELERSALIGEATELTLIFSAIIRGRSN
jgi:four helix bundle protein